MSESRYTDDAARRRVANKMARDARLNGNANCEHPWGFGVDRQCIFGCGRVLTDDEIDAFIADEIADGERQAAVPEMASFLDDPCWTSP